MLKRDFRIMKSASAAPATEAEEETGEAPAEKSDDVTHELTNIRVHEVSLVDRAANRRKFLVKKSDKKEKVEAASEEASTEKAEVLEVEDIVDLGEPNTGGKPRKKSAKPPEEAKPEEKTPPVETKPVAETEKPSEKPTESETPTEQPPVPPVETPPATPAAETPPANAPAAEPGVTVVEEGVSKVGRPMARARLDKLKGAMKTLLDIMGEVDTDDGEDKGDKAEKAEAAPVAAAASVDESVIKELRGNIEGLQKAINEQAKVIEALRKMVANQGEQLSKSSLPIDSNRLSVEKPENGHDKVLWPADMSVANSARARGRSF